MSQKVIAALGVLVVIVVALLGWSVLSRKSTVSPLIPSPSVTVQNVSQPENSVSSSIKEITVEGYDFRFDPSSLTFKQGERVKLTFKNNGKFAHNLTIGDLNVSTKTIQPGQSDSVEFVPNRTGTFSYTCTVDSHADRGMTGSLVVD